MDQFLFFFESSDLDIICVPETWFEPIVLISLLNLSIFNIFRCDRRSHAAGEAIYVRNGIVCEKCYTSDPKK